jgi:hypothetical protein
MNGSELPQGQHRSVELFALYRGDVLLGHFEGSRPVMHHDVEVGRVGFLDLIDPSTPVEAIMQTVSRIMPGVRQSRFPARSEEGRSHAVAALRPMTEEEARGVPPELQLRIGLPDGTVIVPTLVHIRQFELPEGVDVAELPAAYGLPDRPLPRWMISFADVDESTSRPGG